MSVTPVPVTSNSEINFNSQIVEDYKKDNDGLHGKCLDDDGDEFQALNVLKVEDIVDTDSDRTENQTNELKLKEKAEILINLYEYGVAIDIAASSLGINYNTANNIITKYKRNGKMLDNKNLNNHKEQFETSNVIKIKEEIVEETESDPLIASNEIEIDSEKETEISLKRRLTRLTISKEKKEILINLYESGMTIVKAATAVGIKTSSASTIIKRYKEDGGKLLQRRWGGHRKSLRTQEVLKTIKEIVETNPSITLQKIQMKLIEQSISKNFFLSKTSIHKALNNDLEELTDCRRKHRTSKILKNKETRIVESNSHVEPNKINVKLNEEGDSNISTERMETLINLYESGMPIVDAANAVKINCNTAHNIIRRHSKEGVVVRKLWICNKKNPLSSKELENREEIAACHPSIMTKNFQSVEKGRQTISKEHREQKKNLINLNRPDREIDNLAKVGIKCHNADSVTKRKKKGREKSVEKTEKNKEIVENSASSTNNEIKFQLDEKGRQSISNAKKIMLINLYKSGTPIVDAANYVGINCSSANSIIRRYKLDGEEFIEKQWGGHRKRLRTQEVLKIIKEMVKINPSLTLHKIQMELNKKGFTLSIASIHKALYNDLGISTKIVRRHGEKLFVECDEKI